jgi:uncharacterized protein YecT (DUF1311 family)
MQFSHKKNAYTVRTWLAILCFLSCSSSRADAVFDELANRSKLPKEELQELLKNCDASQASMDFCAYRDFVKEDLAMDSVLKEKLQSLPKTCQQKLQKKQDGWVRKRDRTCNKDADDQAKGGSMRPTVFAMCLSSMTNIRAVDLKKISGCSSVR